MTDLHRQKAAELFGVPIEDVTDDQRRYAKTVGYAQFYSMQSPALLRQRRPVMSPMFAHPYVGTKQ